MTTTLLLFSLAVLAVLNLIVLLKLGAQSTNAKPETLQKLESEISRLDPLLRSEWAQNRAEQANSAKQQREELNYGLKTFGDSLRQIINELSVAQQKQLLLFAEQLLSQNKVFEQTVSQKQNDFYQLQKQKFEDLMERQEHIRHETENKLREIRETVQQNLKTLQEDNNKKLEAMRQTVEEKLQQTVEQRFNESFKLISERLEQVHKGLGEMQTLASGVGDLKKVLSNVKTRGNIGEIQLGALLEQLLSPEQYLQNTAVQRGGQERVEFAIKLPGNSAQDQSILLPIDSKFPIEDYLRLQEAYEQSEAGQNKDIEYHVRQFEYAVRKNAKDIRDKYIHPPYTTDFALMFVPTEGLYAEILRRRGLVENLQKTYKITVVGPTNLAAFLSSLQMGFRTLAIEKRSSEVWELLGAVKSQFGLFGHILEKTKKKLQEASNVIDQAQVRSRSIERQLKNVEELPQAQSKVLLGEASIENPIEE